MIHGKWGVFCSVEVSGAGDWVDLLHYGEGANESGTELLAGCA